MRRSTTAGLVLLALGPASGAGASSATPVQARPQGAQAVVRSYPLGLNDGATAAALVRPLLSSAGTVLHDPRHNRLVVYDRPDVHARIAAALEGLAVAPRQVRVTVTEERDRSEGADGVSAGFEPGRVVVAGGASRTEARSRTQQQILVVSGGRGSIRVAEQSPHAEWLWSWGAGAGILTGVRWHEVGTSLAVAPTVLDDRSVLVKVTPEFLAFRDGGHDVVEVTRLASEVVVRAGDAVDLGGLMSADREFARRFLAGFDRSGRAESVRLRLSATVE